MRLGSENARPSFRRATARRCYLPSPDTMAEAPSTEKKTTKKPAQKKASQAAPEQTGWVTDWRAWGIAGAILVFGVIGWKLLGSTYNADIHTICDGEVDSGYTLEKDMSKVTTYVAEVSLTRVQ